MSHLKRKTSTIKSGLTQPSHWSGISWSSFPIPGDVSEVVQTTVSSGLVPWESCFSTGESSVRSASISILGTRDYSEVCTKLSPRFKLSVF